MYLGLVLPFVLLSCMRVFIQCIVWYFNSKMVDGFALFFFGLILFLLLLREKYITLGLCVS